MSFLEKLTEVAKKTLPRRYVDFEVVGGISVFAKQEDGLYSLYLPCSCSYSRHTFELSKGLQCVCTNIETFLCYEETAEEMLLVKVKKDRNKGFWMPIFPYDFSLFLDEDLVRARFNDIPKIYFDVESNASIRKDLDCLPFESVCFVLIDGKNYYIKRNGISLDSRGTRDVWITIREFKSVESIPVAHEFLVKDEKGQYFLDVYNCHITFGPGAVIEVIPTEEYPLLSEQYTGYYLKDKKENILGIYIASNDFEGNNKYSYRVLFDNPVKATKFLKRIIIEEADEEESLPKLASDIWGVTYCDGKKEIITQIIGDNFNRAQYSIDKSDVDF